VPGKGAAVADPVAIPADATLDDAERIVIRAALRRHRTRARAARALGIGLRTLYTKLAAWGPEEDAESA
jgi:DNA-binding NtrC family response regulator